MPSVSCTEAADLVEFIRQMPFVVETDKYIFVHAGIDLTWMIGMKRLITRKSAQKAIPRSRKSYWENHCLWAYTSLWFAKARPRYC